MKISLRLIMSNILACLALCLTLVVFPLDVCASMDGAQKIEFLLKNLESDSDFKVRIAAANALGKIADGSVVDWMIRSFRREQNPAVRLATLYAIGQIPDHRGVPPLLELVSEEILDDKELLAIERILWNFRLAIALDPWKAALVSSSDRSERATSAWLLGIVGGQNEISVLSTGSRDRSPIVRMRALQGIGRIGLRSGQKVCEERLRAESDPMARQAAQTCLGMLDLIARKKLPAERSHRVDLHIDLYGLIPQSVTPELFANYQKKNVNPRAVDLALAVLAPHQAEQREDRTIPLIEGEFIRKTFRLDADLISTRPVPKADVNRIRGEVRNQTANINQCYIDVQKKERTLSGSVDALFQIQSDGRVTNIHLQGGTLQNEQVLTCIQKSLGRLTFRPIPIDHVKMKYTFSFTPPKEDRFDFAAEK